MALKNGLLIADIFHGRVLPKRHKLHYRVYYLSFPLRALSSLPSRVLSLNRFNLFSFYEKDYGIKNLRGEAHARAILSQFGITAADGDIVLVTMPRLLGYAFNPVSFWFCLDRSSKLRAVISEVNNTFGERHCYLSAHEDQRVIGPLDALTSQKLFHVSPFLKVEGNYVFRFAYEEQRIGAWIDYYVGEEKHLTTSISGTRYDLSDKNLLGCFFRYPLVTFKVITMIHFHALKLVLKGIRYHRKPSPPLEEISR